MMSSTSIHDDDATPPPADDPPTEIRELPYRTRLGLFFGSLKTLLFKDIDELQRDINELKVIEIGALLKALEAALREEEPNPSDEIITGILNNLKRENYTINTDKYSKKLPKSIAIIQELAKIFSDSDREALALFEARDVARAHLVSHIATGKELDPKILTAAGIDLTEHQRNALAALRNSRQAGQDPTATV